jgi:hypothetical protein
MYPPSGSVQACNGTFLPFAVQHHNSRKASVLRLHNFACPPCSQYWMNVIENYDSGLLQTITGCIWERFEVFKAVMIKIKVLWQVCRHFGRAWFLNTRAMPFSKITDIDHTKQCKFTFFFSHPGFFKVWYNLFKNYKHVAVWEGGTTVQRFLGPGLIWRMFSKVPQGKYRGCTTY